MFGRRGFIGAAMAGLVVCGTAAPLSAQTIFGTHRWQMQPYCNVVTLTLSPSPAGARLEGADNLCGAANLGSAIGMATGNNAGHVTLNFTIVTAPDARPVHVTAVVNLRDGNGVWTDSGGNSGTMAYGANTPGLPVRPVPVTQIGPNVITTLEIAPGAVNLSDINPAEVQARVSGSCAAGQAMTGINADGSVTCTPVTGGGGGTPVAFKAGGHQGSGNYLPYAQYTDVTWTSTRFNTGGGTFSQSGTTYTVPAAGTYLLTGTVRVLGYQTSGTYCGGFRVNGTVVALTCNKYIANAQVDTDDITLSTTAELAAGDTVVVSVLPLIVSGLTISGSNQAEANFTVTKLH